MDEKEETMEQKYGIKIVLLFLQKVDLMTDRERAAIITTIELINTPVFAYKRAD